MAEASAAAAAVKSRLGPAARFDTVNAAKTTKAGKPTVDVASKTAVDVVSRSTIYVVSKTVDAVTKVVDGGS